MREHDSRPAGVAQRADAFVSYSRKDAEFVRQLVDGLEAHGKGVWIDWEDIPPSVEWFEQITAGIDGADNFVYVISPDSVASEVCRRELDHAAAGGKRILPVLARPVDSKLVPEAAARINWILCERSTALEAGIRTLIEQMETDLAHVQGHTRWLQAAQDWERQGRDASYQLRGSELAAAEQWLAAAAGKEPAPTHLQSELVLRSRQGASRRQRQLLAGVSVALVVSIGLTIFALIQRSTAIDQRNTATARELGVQAERNLDNDPELSLLLAAEGVKAKASTESEDVLRAALVRSRVRARHDLGAEIDAVEISPRRNLYFVSTRDDRGYVYDMHADRRLATFPTKSSYHVAWDPSGRRLAVAGVDGVARIYEARTGRTLARLKTGRELVFDIEWDPDGRLVALSAMDIVGTGADTTPVGGVAEVWDVGSERKLATLKHYPRATLKSRGVGVATLAWTDGGRTLLTGGGGRVRVWRAGSWKQRRVLRLPADEKVSEIHTPAVGSGVAVTESHPTGAFAAVEELDFERIEEFERRAATRLWDLRRGRPIRGFRGPFRAAAINDLGTEMAVEGSRNDTIEIYDIQNRQLLPSLTGHEGAVDSLEYAGLFDLVSASDDGTVRVWNTHEAEPIATLTGHSGAVHAADLELGIESQRVVSGGKDGTVRVWSVFPELPVASHRGREGPGSFLSALSPDGRVAVSKGGARVIDVWGAKTGKLVRRLSPGGRVVAAQFTRDGDRLISLHLGTGSRRRGVSVVWDTATWREVARLGDAVNTSESGRLVSTGGEDATVWSLAGERVVSIRPGHGALNDAVLSDDGDRLLTASEGRVAQLWSVPGGKLLHTLRGHGGPVNPAERDPAALGAREHTPGVATGDFDADGERVATAGADGTARVWDVGSGRQLAVMNGHTESVASVEFSPDGSRLLTGSADGTGRLWRVATGRQVLSVDHLPPAFRFFADTRAAWTSDGRYFLTDGLNSQRVSLWHADSGLRVVQAVGEHASLRPGGHELVTALDERSAVYRCVACARADGLLDAVPARTTRELSKEERVRYLHESP